jgi:hypothetical protein
MPLPLLLDGRFFPVWPATWTRELCCLDQFVPIATLVIAFATVVFTTYMLSRQVRQMEHERNALAILEAIDRLTSTEVVDVFTQLRGVDRRYPTDKDFAERFCGSDDERALNMVGQFVETIACLARREVVDVTLICDAVGYMLRERWATIEPFVMHWRRYNNNEFLFENFEWLAKYSAWWKDTPRPNVPNYNPKQFVAKS